MKIFLNMLYTVLMMMVILLLSYSSVFCQYSQGLVGHWSFDNCKAIDSSISKYNGTPNSGIKCTFGIQGQAYQFDGKNDFIDIGNRSLFKKGDDFTITAWIRIQPNSGDDGFSAIITKWENGGGPQEWWFGVYNDELHFTTQGYPCATNCDGRMSNGIDLIDNCWVFVGVVVTGNNRVQYIKDGKIFDEDKNDYAFTPQNTSIRIGRQNPNNRPAARFTGGIDEVRVYNRALSISEIESLYLKDYKDPLSPTYSEVHICKGDSVALSVNANFPAQYNWSPNYYLSCLNCPAPLAYPDSTTLYNCETKANDGGCENTNSVIKVIVDTIQNLSSSYKEVHICKGDSAALNSIDNFPARYNWSPNYYLSCANCPAPYAYPDTTAIYTCEAKAISGCVKTTSTIKVIVDTVQKAPFDFQLSRDCKVTPDSRFEMSITTNDNLNSSGIKEFTAEISFNNRWMSLDSTIGINTIRTGKILDQSWVIEKKLSAKDTLSTLSIWCKGQTPIGTGDSLLSIGFRSYLPDVLEYEPTLRVDVRSSIGCFEPTVADGFVSLQSCFIGARRINVSNTSYSLAVIREQKSNDNVTILYSIGLRGKTTVGIYDSEGKLLKQLIDEIQENGEYSLSVSPSLPSGFYFCRIKSGHYDYTTGFAIAR